MSSAPAFRPPPWASQPCRCATLERFQGVALVSKLPIDTKPYVLLGRVPELVDVPIEHATCSRVHAAIVHHTDGRVFLIDLGSTHGTHMNGAAVPPNKPTAIKDGAVLTFGQLETTFVARVESTAEKRGGGGGGGEDQPASKRQAPGGATMVRASHLLVKHKDSRRPSSWKEPVVTRTQEEALQMIQAFRERLVQGQADFGTLAAAESHCSSAQCGGDLGDFGPGQMQKAFEDAAFSLQVGELSPPVFSDSGVHLVLRTG